ncbi:MAG: c-type cytochrome [Zoogloeaceae bacterium]|jgi:cytochrome c oxidase cbb3-type subunit 3|nr:c-type cytochrome [Zoogloeaceae bacterium]
MSALSTFWSLWVMALVTFNLGLALFLFIWSQRVKIPTLPDGTTGHVWAHGMLREGLHKLPLWWTLFSAAMFILAIGYLVRYPGFGAFKGTLDWTEYSQLAGDRAASLGKLQDHLRRHEGQTLAQIAADADAVAMGKRLFIDNCAACHGREALGNPALGAPNLVDADALYGNDDATLLASILNGRNGIMPPLGGAIAEADITATAHYVRSLSGLPHDVALAQKGQATFTTICAACHTPQGTGNPALGAPNLTDAVWLKNGELTTIENTIRNGRSGEMPAWDKRLGEQNARLIGAWLHARRNAAPTPPAGGGK